MIKEKRLYDLLIIVYRSPELMIKMTGAKQQYLKEPAPALADGNNEHNSAISESAHQDTNRSQDLAATAIDHK